MKSAEAIRLTARVMEKADKHRAELRTFWGDLQALIRFVRAWATGEYRRVPWRTVAVAVAALLYLLDPLDAIPDWLPGIGFIDDAAVTTALIATIRKDLERFMRWEEQGI